MNAIPFVTSIAKAGMSTATITVRTTLGENGDDVERETTPSTLAPGETALVRQRFYVQQPCCEAPITPHLYTARASLGDDAPVDVTFGIRTMTVDPRKGLRIGSGVLSGICSANPKTEERFDSATWRTLDGRALAVVRPQGAGEITVTVSSPGLDPVVLTLSVS